MPGRTTDALPWRDAMQRALYGDHGFYTRGAGPAAHFRTSVHASPMFAEALLGLARSADLGTVVDVGSGRGELLVALRAMDPALRLVGVDVVARPDLPDGIDWSAEVPAVDDALLVANEWLDDVPLDVAVRTADGVRRLLVDPAGAESVGDLLATDDRDWVDRWWPLTGPDARAEVGRSRDEAWAAALRRVGRGLAVAVDYAHTAADRPVSGTLTGYRDGRQVPPVPDGSCDVTAHVALDSVAAAGAAAGADWTVLTTQRESLGALLREQAAPAHERATSDPAGYLRELSRGGQRAELRDPAGLGGFGWLVQGVGVPVPPALSRLAGRR